MEEMASAYDYDLVGHEDLARNCGPKMSIYLHRNAPMPANYFLKNEFGDTNSIFVFQGPGLWPFTEVINGHNDTYIPVFSFRHIRNVNSYLLHNVNSYLLNNVSRNVSMHLPRWQKPVCGTVLVSLQSLSLPQSKCL